MVQIPESGEFINIRPFIKFITADDMQALEISPQALKESASAYIRFISTRMRLFDGSAFDEETIEKSNVLDFLYRICDLADETFIVKRSKK